MIDFINIHIQNIVSNVPNSFVSNVKEMIGMPEENSNIRILKDSQDILIHLGGDGKLCMYLTGVGGLVNVILFLETIIFLRSSAPVYK